MSPEGLLLTIGALRQCLAGLVDQGLADAAGVVGRVPHRPARIACVCVQGLADLRQKMFMKSSQAGCQMCAKATVLEPLG